MATYTPNYKLKKPAASEYYNIQDFNEKADKIDTQLKIGEEAKTLADTLNSSMTEAQRDITLLLQRSLISFEIWAPPNTQVMLQQGQLSFSGTVGDTMELTASVSALGTWQMMYVYANKTYSREVRLEHIGQTRILAAPTLAASPWAYIAKLSAAGLAREAYALGDTKSVSSSLGTYDMQIIGFAHDVLTAAKAGQERAGITFQMKSATPANYFMDENIYFAYTWEQTNMRTVQLPAILQSMPSDLRTVIKQVNKYTAVTGNNIGKTTKEKLFLFSDYELCGYSRLINDYCFGQQYEYYRFGHTPNKSTIYWLRNNISGPNGKENFLVMHPDILQPGFYRCEGTYGISLGFCV